MTYVVREGSKDQLGASVRQPSDQRPRRYSSGPAGGLPTTGSGIAAGADAVACGTAFLAAHEADVHPLYLDRLIRAEADDTILTRLFDGGWPGAPHRVIRNETVVGWEVAGAPLRGARPGEGDVVAHRHAQAVVRYADAQPTRDTTGDIGAMAMYAGHSVGHIKGSEPGASIIGRLARGLS